MPESSIPRWFWAGWSIAAAVAIGVALLSATQADNDIDDSVAEQWMKAVSRYGIEPVYPPQEDIYVGDIFAVIANDVARDVSLGPLPKRAIKLKHADLTQSIEREYGDVYKFPKTTEPPSEGKVWEQVEATSPLFARKEPMKTLPIALLPDFTVTTKRKAKFASRWERWAAAFDMSASRDKVTTLKIGGLLTYGVSAMAGEIALEEFCADATTQSLCYEASLRQQLSNILGDEIRQQVVDPVTGEQRPRYAVELSLVTRVYLMRHLKTVISDGEHGEFGGKAGSSGKDEANNVSAELSGSKDRGSVIEIAAQTFERPVVLGFRGVRRRGSK